MLPKTRIIVVIIAIFAIVFLTQVFFDKADLPDSASNDRSSKSQSPKINEIEGLKTTTSENSLASIYTNAKIPIWAGDEIFATIDPALIDDSVVQEAIAGVELNRYRVVKVNQDMIRSLIREAEEGSWIALNLFNDLTVNGKALRVNEYHEGQRAGFASWSGTVNDESGTLVSISISPGGSTSINVKSRAGSIVVDSLSHTPFHIVKDFVPTKLIFEGDTYSPN